jgi:hypothetical protein
LAGAADVPQFRAVRWPANVQPYFDAMLLD